MKRVLKQQTVIAVSFLLRTVTGAPESEQEQAIRDILMEGCDLSYDEAETYLEAGRTVGASAMEALRYNGSPGEAWDAAFEQHAARIERLPQTAGMAKLSNERMRREMMRRIGEQI